jgi:hypothetical protein
MTKLTGLKIGVLLLLLGGAYWCCTSKTKPIIEVGNINQEAQTVMVKMQYKGERIEGMRKLGAVHQSTTKSGHIFRTITEGNQLIFQIWDKEKGLVIEKEVTFN